MYLKMLLPAIKLIAREMTKNAIALSGIAKSNRLQYKS